jgi:hypothetical protein
MAEKMISEILQKAGSLKTKKEKIEYLRSQNSKTLRTILKGAFDPSVTFLLPEGEPPYRKDDAPKGFEPSNLHKMTRRFKYFDVGGIGERLDAAKREKIFINVLESLHPDEAELVILMKDKKLQGKYKGITKKLVSDVWPTLIAGSREGLDGANPAGEVKD